MRVRPETRAACCGVALLVGRRLGRERTERHRLRPPTRDVSAAFRLHSGPKFERLSVVSEPLKFVVEQGGDRGIAHARVGRGAARPAVRGGTAAGRRTAIEQVKRRTTNIVIGYGVDGRPLDAGPLEVTSCPDTCCNSCASISLSAIDCEASNTALEVRVPTTSDATRAKIRTTSNDRVTARCDLGSVEEHGGSRTTGTGGLASANSALVALVAFCKQAKSTACEGRARRLWSSRNLRRSTSTLTLRSSSPPWSQHSPCRRGGRQKAEGAARAGWVEGDSARCTPTAAAS